MIHLPDNKEISYILGSRYINIKSREPYNEIAINFLSDFSKKLLSNSLIKKHSDIITLAFWCRKKNIENLKMKYYENSNRLGLGLIFHIAPSNVPINFMISYIYGLLSGNSNIIRIPSKEFPQTNIILSVIKELIADEKYLSIKESTQFISYQKNDEVTSYFSLLANGRVIWGGDETITHIRKLESAPKSVDITFSDRYSFCILKSDSVLKLDKGSLNQLAQKFYNDTFIMDQNACSSPHLILWQGTNVKEAKKIFWNEVCSIISEKYILSEILSIDKYTKYCEFAIDNKAKIDIINYKNLIYCVQLSFLEAQVTNLRGSGGYFYEYTINNLNEILPIISNKIQTLTYFGFDKDELKDFVINNSLLGIDRIVPIGSALDISLIWDGYDIIKSLSRIIDIK